MSRSANELWNGVNWWVPSVLISWRFSDQ